MGNISLFSNSEEKTTAMDLIKGKSLMKVDGSMQSAESALAGKDIVMFYFSAHWCPPCRGFTPILKEFYEVRFNLITELLWLLFNFQLSYVLCY